MLVCPRVTASSLCLGYIFRPSLRPAVHTRDQVRPLRSGDRRVERGYGVTQTSVHVAKPLFGMFSPEKWENILFHTAIQLRAVLRGISLAPQKIQMIICRFSCFTKVWWLCPKRSMLFTFLGFSSE